MSKRNRPHHGRRNLAWPIIAFGAILVIGALLLFARPTGGGGANSQGTAAISVDQTKIDYGYVKFGETRSFKLAVTNTGDGPLRFKSKPYIEVLEGC